MAKVIGIIAAILVAVTLSVFLIRYSLNKNSASNQPATSVIGNNAYYNASPVVTNTTTNTPYNSVPVSQDYTMTAKVSGKTFTINDVKEKNTILKLVKDNLKNAYFCSDCSEIFSKSESKAGYNAAKSKDDYLDIVFSNPVDNIIINHYNNGKVKRNPVKELLINLSPSAFVYTHQNLYVRTTDMNVSESAPDYFIGYADLLFLDLGDLSGITKELQNVAGSQ